MIYCHLDCPLLRFQAEEVMKANRELVVRYQLYKRFMTPGNLARVRSAELQLKVQVRKYQLMGKPSQYVNVALAREAEVRQLKHAASHAKHASTTGKAAPNKTTNQEKLRRADDDRTSKATT